MASVFSYTSACKFLCMDYRMVYQWIVEWYTNWWLSNGNCVRMAE